MDIPGLFFIYFWSFSDKQYNFSKNKCENVWNRTHNLINTSLLPLPLDLGSHPMWPDFFKRLFNIWQNSEPTLAIFCAIVQKFIVLKGQILKELTSHLVTLQSHLKTESNFFRTTQRWTQASRESSGSSTWRWRTATAPFWRPPTTSKSLISVACAAGRRFLAVSVLLRQVRSLD